MAPGSHAGWNGQPKHLRVCAHCREPLTLKTPGGLFFSDAFRVEGYPSVWHHACVALDPTRKAALRKVAH